jgi:very-short-patch-repair endonuclease
MGRAPKDSVPTTIRIKKPKIDYPKLLLDQILITDLPVPVREHKFHPTRRWRFDLAFLESKLAVEVEGGIWTYGRHNRAISFIKDMEKYNEACLLGWNLLRFTTDMVKKGESIKIISKFFEEQ